MVCERVRVGEVKQSEQYRTGRQGVSGCWLKHQFTSPKSTSLGCTLRSTHHKHVSDTILRLPALLERVHTDFSRLGDVGVEDTREQLACGC
jgi:hypothetical protein